MEESTFGDLLRGHLQNQVITYEKLGKKLGVDKSTVGRWINNQQKPDFEQLRRIPRALGLSEGETEELLRADGRKYSYKDLWITVPEDNPETKSEVSKPKTEESSELSKNTESKGRSFGVQLTEAELVDQNNLRSLRRVVKENWIDNYLEHSLHHEAVIWLKLRDQPHMVDNLPYKTIPQGEQDTPILPGTGTPIIDAFDKMGQRLLILGEPGSGKTIMILELARALLKRTEETSDYPTPVVFPLASWSESKGSLEKWMAEELSVHYKFPKKYGSRWIEQDKLLPLLDGLDEVQLSDREACVEAINQFHLEHLVPIVVSSRLSDYENLSKQLKLQGAVVLEPFTSHQINTYLNKAGTSLSALRNILIHDTELRELAESPLTLDIMSIAYRDATLEELSTIDTSQTRRQSLYNTYIQRMFGRREAEPAYLPLPTIQWLQWLASRLLQYKQSIFQIERIQPTWLQLPSDKRVSFIPLIMFLAMIMYGTIFGLSIRLVELPIAIINGLPISVRNFINGFILAAIVGSIIGLTISVIEGVSGRYKRIDTMEQSDALLRRLKSSLYTALLWGMSSFLTPFLIKSWFAKQPLRFLALVDWINGFAHPITSQTHGILDRLGFWMYVISSQTNIEVSNGNLNISFNLDQNIEMTRLINGGLFGEFGGGLSDVFFAWLIRVVFLFFNSRQFVLLFGVIGGLIGALREIEFAEKINWSWSRIQYNLYSGVMVASSWGIFSGIFVGLFVSLSSQQQNDPFLVVGILILMNMLVWGLSSSLFGMITGGFIFTPTSTPPPVSTIILQKPNQGIWLSAKYSLRMGLLGAVFCGVASWLSGLMPTISSALFFGLFCAPVFALIGRSDAVIKHCTLRLLLWWNGYTPWNYARFLDYAAELIFLRKIGGGYIFIHRSIMEHFASLDKEAIERIIDKSASQKKS